MLTIASFIGDKKGLVSEIFYTTPPNDAGLAPMQALCIAFLGLAIDLLVQTWCYHRTAAFGISEKNRRLCSVNIYRLMDDRA